MTFEYSILANKLREGNLVAFLGAGASRTYIDSDTGKKYDGLPGANEMVTDIARKKPYINSAMTFEQAFFMIKNREGRAELERVLQGYIDLPHILPLPSHDLLANMPFSAFMTTNFDQLMERALDKNRKKYSTIISNEDVARWKGNQIPLVKLHGCISRPTSIIAAEDECFSLQQKYPVVSALTVTLLSNRVILFLGYSLQDPDFHRMYEEVKTILGNHMPTSYAIVKEPSDYQIDYWKANGLTLINSDLTAFLRELLRTSLRAGKPSVYHPNDDWINNSFFESLVDIRTSPSETQAIDAFLDHLLSEIRSTSLSSMDILDRASIAVDTVLKRKPNYEAFRNLWGDIKPCFKQNSDPYHTELESSINTLIESRRGYARKLNSKWQDVVQTGQRILLYSQSIRMMEFLKAVSPRLQSTCLLFIAECRPKSPDSFQDAAAICDFLKDTNYRITLIPDVCAGNLFARNQIDSVFMGAHSIYFKDEKPMSFVNTCGTLMISVAANYYNIPLYVIAEKAKHIVLGSNDDEHISYEEEEDIFNDELITSLRINHSTEITGQNIGYDLCPVFENIQFISNDS